MEVAVIELSEGEGNTEEIERQGTDGEEPKDEKREE